MVLHHHANVESYVAMYVPRLTFFGFDASHNHTSQWCKWALYVVVLPMHVRICQYFWHHVALLEQINGEFCWSNKVAPQREWKPVVNSAEDCHEIFFNV
jgi:hypothetical protein